MADGKEFLYRLRQGMSEDSDSSFLDARTSYTYLWEGATEFVNRTECLRAEQAITTVAEQEENALAADFLRFYMRDSSGDFFVKYNDGTNVSFPTFVDYQEIYHANNTTSVSVPDRFSVIDRAIYSRITGTCTSSGALSAGEATLTDSAADFTNVSAGDIIHNTTDVSDGIVLSKTSSTVLVTALFGGTDNDWDSTDAYVIQPQGRLQLILDPPPSTSGHTVTVPYIQRPAPVFSSYGVYKFQPQYIDALVAYVQWKYKYRDREPQFGDALFQMFERATRMNQFNLNQTFQRTGLKVNLKKRI